MRKHLQSCAGASRIFPGRGAMRRRVAERHEHLRLRHAALHACLGDRTLHLLGVRIEYGVRIGVDENFGEVLLRTFLIAPV